MFNYKLSPFQFKITPLLKKELLPRKQSGKISLAMIVTQLAETLLKQRMQAGLPGRGLRTATTTLSGTARSHRGGHSNARAPSSRALWLCWSPQRESTPPVHPAPHKGSSQPRRPRDRLPHRPGQHNQPLLPPQLDDGGSSPSAGPILHRTPGAPATDREKENQQRPTLYVEGGTC